MGKLYLFFFGVCSWMTVTSDHTASAVAIHTRMVVMGRLGNTEVETSRSRKTRIIEIRSKETSTGHETEYVHTYIKTFVMLTSFSSGHEFDA